MKRIGDFLVEKYKNRKIRVKIVGNDVLLAREQLLYKLKQISKLDVLTQLDNIKYKHI